MNDLEKEFIPYQESLELKKLGFDKPCFKCKVIGMEHLDYTPTDYDDFPEQKEKEVLIPTFSQAFRFFREKYSLPSYVRPECPDVEPYYDFVINEDVYDVMKNTHEEAELACLRKLIEIVKNN